jgi:signal transduction histidine kinase/integral membrane sensor domain MASE1/CheY-like chemotaxis protein
MVTPRWPLADLSVIVALAALYVVAAKLGLKLALVHASATAVWPPTGIALAALLLLGSRMWPGIFVGAFVANVTTAGSVATSLGIATGNTLEALLGVQLVTRFASGRHPFVNGQEVIKFLVLAAMVSTTVSATLGVGSLVLTGFAQWGDAGSIWLTWWLGDAAGDILVAPFLILWAVEPWPRWSSLKLLEAAGLVVSLGVIGQFVFGPVLLRGAPGYPIDFLAVPPLVWAAFRFGQRETATASLVLASMALWGTLYGYGPFARETLNESLLLLQAFMGITAVFALAFAAVVAEWRRVNEERLALLPEAQAARRLAEDAEKRASFLAEASAVLGSSLDLDATLVHLTRLAVPVLADGCSVDLLQESGMTRRVAQTHIDPAKDVLMRDARARHGFNPATSGVPEVLRTRRSILMSRTTDKDLMAAARNPEQLNMFRTLDLRAWMVLPLIARERVLGAMTYIITESDRRYGPGDLSLAEAVANRAAAAIDNARLYREAEAARTEAETANRLKDEFLAMLGHELRNPLGAISNAVHILDRVDDPHGLSATHARQIIARQVQHLGGLIDDLLDVGRVMTGKIHLERSSFDLYETADHALNTLRTAGKTGDHALMLTGQPVWIDGDATRIEQVVLNLVENALRYTPPGGSIHLEVAREDGRAVLRVQDSGIGIRPELLPRIFDLFVQGDRALDRSRGGLGIGLTLVKRLVELHDGTVQAASDGPGTGSVFTISFPALAAPAARSRMEVAATSGPARRVALIEDNADARESLRVLLELYGHEVHEAADGPTGVELVLRLRPDVTFVDIGLPGVDGYEVAQRIRAAPHGQGLRLVALTGYGLPEDERHARQAGFDAHLTKPVHPTAMQRILQATLPGQTTSSG